MGVKMEFVVSIVALVIAVVGCVLAQKRIQIHLGMVLNGRNSTSILFEAIFHLRKIWARKGKLNCVENHLQILSYSVSKLLHLSINFTVITSYSNSKSSTDSSVRDTNADIHCPVNY